LQFGENPGTLRAMRRILEWLGHFNTITGIAILFGVPVSLFTGIGSAIWWRFDHLRWSYIAVLMLAVFGLTLWSWIGLIWIFDRAKAVSSSKLPVKPTLDCAWGLAVDGAFLAFDPNNPIACQVTVNLRNLLSWPLRIEVVAHQAQVEGMVPDMTVSPSPPAVVPQGTFVTVGFNGYKKGTIPEKKNYKGKIEMTINYGHPDVGMSRQTIRFYNFELQMQDNPFQMMLPLQPGLPAPPLLGKFAVALSHSKQEEDKPL